MICFVFDMGVLKQIRRCEIHNILIFRLNHYITSITYFISIIIVFVAFVKSYPGLYCKGLLQKFATTEQIYKNYLSNHHKEKNILTLSTS